MIESAIIIFFVLLAVIVFAAFMKITWNISKTGVDIMEFFGNAGRPGTSREQFRDKPKEEKKTKWSKDGTKEI